MKIQGSLELVLLLLLLAGCGANTNKQNQLESPKTPAEIGDFLESGPVLLNVSGAGYQIGDVVRVETDVSEVSKGNIVLFDWRSAVADQGGFGPTYLIGLVIATPGDELDMSTFLKFKGRDGKDKNAWFSTFERRGAKTYDSKITLPARDYLVETDNDILVVDLASVGALVVERLRHDNDAKKETNQRVY